MDERIITIKQVLNYHWQANTGYIRYTLNSSPNPQKIRLYSDRIIALISGLSNTTKLRTVDLRKLKLADNYIHFTHGNQYYKIEIVR